jgi:hypothetical protein
MRKRIYIVLAAVCGLALIAGIVVATGLVGPGGTSRCSKGGSPPGASPLGPGKPTTVARAQTIARFPVLIPDVRAARLSNLTRTWATDQPSVALDFADGRVLIILAPAHYTNARANFEKFITQNHATAVIGNVHQHPALVITPNTDACGSNPAVVEFDHKGIDVTIYSGSYGTDTLLAIANSLRQRIPWHRS